ncbi:MAG: glycosyltransferase family 4 protein, partial [Chloroflexi bacterium]|nr:glycosyltransferase family 4 protein [Chloroflexota bacterium]
MRIAIVSQPLDLLIPPYENSIGIWTNHIAHQMARSNPVTVFAKRNRVQQGIPAQPNLKYVFVSSIPNKVVNMLGKMLPDGKIPVYAWCLYYLDYILPVALQIRREGFDIIHVHNFSQFVPILRQFNPHTKIVLHMACEWLTQLDYDVMDQRIGKTDLVLGASDYISNKIRNRYPHHAAHCKTCYNGVDVDIFTGSNVPCVEQLDKRRIMFVGRVSPEKGVHDLI